MIEASLEPTSQMNKSGPSVVSRSWPSNCLIHVKHFKQILICHVATLKEPSDMPHSLFLHTFLTKGLHNFSLSTTPITSRELIFCGLVPLLSPLSNAYQISNVPTVINQGDAHQFLCVGIVQNGLSAPGPLTQDIEASNTYQIIGPFEHSFNLEDKVDFQGRYDEEEREDKDWENNLLPSTDQALPVTIAPSLVSNPPPSPPPSPIPSPGGFFTTIKDVHHEPLHHRDEILRSSSRAPPWRPSPPPPRIITVLENDKAKRAYVIFEFLCHGSGANGEENLLEEKRVELFEGKSGEDGLISVEGGGTKGSIMIEASLEPTSQMNKSGPSVVPRSWPSNCLIHVKHFKQILICHVATLKEPSDMPHSLFLHTFLTKGLHNFSLSTTPITSRELIFCGLVPLVSPLSNAYQISNVPTVINQGDAHQFLCVGIVQNGLSAPGPLTQDIEASDTYQIIGPFEHSFNLEDKVDFQGEVVLHLFNLYHVRLLLPFGGIFVPGWTCILEFLVESLENFCVQFRNQFQNKKCRNYGIAIWMGVLWLNSNALIFSQQQSYDVVSLLDLIKVTIWHCIKTFSSKIILFSDWCLCAVSLTLFFWRCFSLSVLVIFGGLLVLFY
ncbi:hypothetical protein RIF29_21466 [Crotalaria pallida]|uniref:Uncharacterized protein n=1 Tax=Crotalaria pallida TaxID=3830 RepID=A0AAN9FBK3_CROPI